MLHIPPSNLLLPAAKQEPYQTAYLLTKNIVVLSWKMAGAWARRQEKGEDRKSTRTRQKNKRGDTDGGGLFLACEEFGRMFDNSFPACTFYFFFYSGD